jgi:hypothetical protein
MVRATYENTPSALQREPLADVLRHVIALKRAPEIDIRSDILEALRSGKLPHWVDRTIRYLPRPLDALKSDPPPMEVLQNEPMPPEVLEINVIGRGSLHIDWRNSKATRRAGSTWLRMEFEGIRCSLEHMLALWPGQVAEPIAPATVPTAAAPPEEAPPDPRTKEDRVCAILTRISHT